MLPLSETAVFCTLTICKIGLPGSVILPVNYRNNLPRYALSLATARAAFFPVPVQ